MSFLNYEKALLFAMQAHEGQRRKGDGLPYIVHPIMVSKILSDEACREEAVIAGLLHDTVEDTDVTLELIEKEFGSTVAGIVAACTERDKSLPWEERKRHSIETIRTASVDAKYVTCADKLHNLQSLMAAHQQEGDAVWEQFSRGFEKQKWYAESMSESLFYGLKEEQIKPMLFEYRKLVEVFYKT